ncbi:DsrE family protein [candidate division WOR-3 bacterium]|nr:DsrE family protein [candidate division WOR-3 bacterium]
MEQAIVAGVNLFVCEQSTQLIGIPRGDFIPDAKIVGAGTLNDLALNADAIISF